MSSGVSGQPQAIFAIDDFSAGVNSIWFGTDSGQFYNINNVDGSIASSSATATTAVRTAPYLFAGFGDASRNTHNIYFGDDDGNFKCRNSSNLKSKPSGWTDVHVSSPVRGSPVYDFNNSMYFGCDNGYLYKVDVSSGGIYWSFKTGGPVRSMPLFIGDGNIYFGSDDGYFYGVNVITGSLAPGFPIAAGAEVRTGAIYGNNGLYFSANDGKVYCIQP
jgi:outer membrane protein assembly factor BamB